ncbi:MAG: DUF3040 domain-containing protein [Actinomycetota bacterium]
MPLSEREQKILEEIERDLYREDPTFARDVRRTRPGLPKASRTRLGAILFLAGFCMLFAFFANRWLVLGVVAFGAMVGGVVLMAGSVRELTTKQHPPRERLGQALRTLEERIRGRYKRD